VDKGISSITYKTIHCLGAVCI